MIDISEAKRIAQEKLVEIRKNCPVDIDINYALTEEYPVGYVFYYNSLEYWETKDFEKSLAGNGPILVSKSDGKALLLPSNKSVKKSLLEI